MNRKGFTLVELLAVIIILALLAVIASTSVTKVVDDSKNDLATAQIKLIEDAAKVWGAENMSALPEGNSCIYLTLKDLKTYGLIDSDIRNPKTEKKLSNDLKIKITSKISNYNTEVLKYEVDPESVEGCTNYYGSICTLASDSEKTGTEKGAKYLCKVDPNKEPYTFYVLSDGENGTTNLIMDSNINKSGVAIKSNDITDKGLVTWNESGDNTNGPVTAMNYLNNATSTWTNLENLNITYNDEGGKYGTIQITGKARLPYKREVYEVGCEDYSVSSCPVWMVDYLEDYGYWTLSSRADESSHAWRVRYSGTVDFYDVASEDGNGVRPVINLKL